MDSFREGEGGKSWENGIKTCVISCMKKKRKSELELVYHSSSVFMNNMYLIK